MGVFTGFFSKLLSVGGNNPLFQLIDKVVPDRAAAQQAQQKLLEMQETGALKELDDAAQNALGQIEVNKQEAQSASLFVAGWRPFIGWVCGAGLVYQFLLQPLLAWATLAFIGKMAAVPPVLDLSTLLTVLGGMLGLAGLRTGEKLKGVARSNLKEG